MTALTENEAWALDALRSLRKGVRPSVRVLQRIMGYRSPRSAAVIINALVEKGFIHKDARGRIVMGAPKEACPRCRGTGVKP